MSTMHGYGGDFEHWKPPFHYTVPPQGGVATRNHRRHPLGCDGMWIPWLVVLAMVVFAIGTMTAVDAYDRRRAR